MKRAERRAATDRIIKRRMRQWKAITGYGDDSRCPGKGRKKSQLDCGKPQCRVCSSPIKGEERIKASDRRKMQEEDDNEV